MKIQAKIALLFASLTGALLLAMGVFVYYLISQNTFEDFYKRLEIRAIVVAKAAFEQDSGSGAAYSDIRDQHLEKLDEEEEYILKVQDRQFTSSTALPPVPADVLNQAVTLGKSTWRDGSRFYYFLLHKGDSSDHIVGIAARNTLQSQYQTYLRQALIISFILAAALAFTVGFFFSKGILRPIRNITGKVREMSASSLHLRLDKPEGSDEIAELAATFNNMLDRLETAFESQNNFVSHASHEFNTPLTSIVGEAEYALSRPRTQEQYVAAITNIQAAAERLYGITRSLLQLAQTGLTGKAQEMTAVWIEELVQKARIMTMDIMPGCEITVNYSLAPSDMQRMVVYGNQTLLELAVTNIVLNACKYSSNKPVLLAVAATKDKVIIVVKDEGIGIPSDELKYIFDPFFRARNTDLYKGYGIGLPLTRNIIRMHKGELIVKSEEGQGTEIQLVLPLSTRSVG